MKRNSTACSQVTVHTMHSIEHNRKVHLKCFLINPLNLQAYNSGSPPTWSYQADESSILVTDTGTVPQVAVYNTVWSLLEQRCSGLGGYMSAHTDTELSGASVMSCIISAHLNRKLEASWPE